MKRISTLLFIAALALGGCKKKSTPAEGSGSASGSAEGSAMGSGSGSADGSAAAAADGSGSGSADGSAAAEGSGSADGSAAAAADVDVPTAMDFEDDADKEITDKNVTKEVTTMEKELGQ